MALNDKTYMYTARYERFILAPRYSMYGIQPDLRFSDFR